MKLEELDVENETVQFDSTMMPENDICTFFDGQCDESIKEEAIEIDDTEDDDGTNENHSELKILEAYHEDSQMDDVIYYPEMIRKFPDTNYFGRFRTVDMGPILHEFGNFSFEENPSSPLRELYSNESLQSYIPSQSPPAKNFGESSFHLARKSTAAQRDSLNYPRQTRDEKLTRPQLAKKTTKPIDEEPMRRIYDPRKDIVALGKSKQQIYLKKYMRVPCDDNKIPDQSSSDKKTLPSSPEKMPEHKLKLFKSTEEVRKKILYGAVHSQESSTPTTEFKPPPRGKETQSLMKPYEDSSKLDHLMKVSVRRLENDQSVKKMFQDYCARKTLHELHQEIKLEPVEYRPRRMSSDSENESNAMPPENVLREWRADEEEWNQLLEEYSPPKLAQEQKKKGKKSTLGRGRGGKRK